ncbi:hypothetical protein F442_12813 [Phytophthora nicotianae P10297]|uniref:START domain-containing protein n=1 Tax=Phytophthora nicotianae P10297 TaxID=1317064 RepID=W2Z0K1_PHYNI|nr:hypothetical protein F442_12813 [Phytophthora nicotianae P10297]
MNTSYAPSLRRTHSLEFQNSQQAELDSFEDHLDADIHAAAQMVEYFDVDKLLNEVSTPVSSAPRRENLTEYPLLTGYSSVELTEAVSDRYISEASDNSASSEVTDSARVVNMASAEATKTQRMSRKDEIIELRESVEVLTDQLEALKAAPFQEAQPPNQSNVDVTSRPKTSLWKYAAIRQLGRRRKAEENNVMLREMLEMQVHEAKCSQRILKRRTKIQMMEDMLGMKRRKTARIASAPKDNQHIFMKMLQETDETYARVDSHFAEKGVTDLPCPGSKRKVNRSAMNGVVFEMMTRNLLPFSLQSTARTARVVLNDLGTSGLKRIEDVDEQIDFHAQESEESRDTLVASYFSATPGHPLATGAQVQKVMRMYIEEDCAVFVWKMVAEPKLRGSNAPIGYVLQSTLQVVMRPGETPTLSGDESTQLLIHFSASRHETGFPINAEFREPEHMDSGIALWKKLVAHIPHGIESGLIDDKCATSHENEVPSLNT